MILLEIEKHLKLFLQNWKVEINQYNYLIIFPLIIKIYKVSISEEHVTPPPPKMFSGFGGWSSELFICSYQQGKK